MIGLRHLGLAAALMVPALAMAATPGPSAAVRAACGPDAKRLCGAVISDPAARHKCMVDHRAKLSEACKSALAQDKRAPAASDAPPESAQPPQPAASPQAPAPAVAPDAN